MVRGNQDRRELAYGQEHGQRANQPVPRRPKEHAANQQRPTNVKARQRRTLDAQCVIAEGDSYQLNPNWVYTFDIGTFEETILRAQGLARGNPERDRLLAQAMKAYKNPVLGDTDAAWCNQLRTELETGYWQAVNDLSDSRRADGDAGQSISILEDALEVDEYREEIYEKLAELYTEAGDLASASNTLRRSKSIFGETVQLFASGGGNSAGEDLAET